LEAIVLAGGLGTRLRSVVSDVPKPMAPVANKPFLEYILKYLSNSGITRVVLSVGYKYEVIKSYFGNSYNGIELVYSVEDEPLGTGGGIKKAMEMVNSSEVYIINGDTFFGVELLALSLDNGSKLQLSLKEMREFDRYGCVECDGEYVRKFCEKEYKKIGNINGGVYLCKKDIFDGFDLEEKFSFEEFVTENIENLKVTAKVFDSYFIDIGIPTDYELAQSEIPKEIKL
jgi:D-glycero-alpha-D-manno-heptose 1-phosphate guanylyltransferase